MPPIIMFIIPQNPNPLLQARLEWGPNIYFYIILKSELLYHYFGPHFISTYLNKLGACFKNFLILSTFLPYKNRYLCYFIAETNFSRDTQNSSKLTTICLIMAPWLFLIYINDLEPVISAGELNHKVKELCVYHWKIEFNPHPNRTTICL